MELQIRNYILYKLRTLDYQKKQLEKLKAYWEERKMDIIDESSGEMDGLPRGKGRKSDPVQNKVIRFEQVEQRIKTLEKELDIIAKFEKKINVMGSLTRRIYNETITHQSNLEYKALEYGMATKTLYNYRSKLIEMLAMDLGEYINIDKLV